MSQEQALRRTSLLQLVMASMMVISVNIYVSYTGYISYYLTNVVGFGVIIAGSFVTIFRIWDAITDVGMGMVVDKTNTRFGKFRPYMTVGGIASFVCSHVMIRVTPFVPEGMPRKAFFVILYMIFVVATTMQACALRSAAQIMTNDSKQRATFGMFNGVLLTVLYSAVPILVYSHIIPLTKGFNLEFFKILLNVISVISLATILMSVFAYRNYDVYNPNAVAKSEKVSLKDAWELMTKNRPFLMLILSAGTDKLATTLQGNATVVVILFAIVAGNSKLSSASNSYTLIPSILMVVLGLGAVGRKFGARRVLLLSSWGGVIVSVLSILLWVLGDPRTMGFPGYEGFTGWNFFTMAYLVLWCLTKGLGRVATSALNPMLADIIDYEKYRSGKYLPGTVSSLFNLADKVISSFGSTVVAVLCAMIGFTNELPTVDTPYSTELFAIGLLGMYGLALIGLIVNLICLKYYDLTPERMAEIRAEMAKR